MAASIITNAVLLLAAAEFWDQRASVSSDRPHMMLWTAPTRRDLGATYQEILTGGF